MLNVVGNLVVTILFAWNSKEIIFFVLEVMVCLQVDMVLYPILCLQEDLKDFFYHYSSIGPASSMSIYFQTYFMLNFGLCSSSCALNLSIEEYSNDLHLILCKICR